VKITVIWVGKTKNKWLQCLIKDYDRRLQHFCKLSITELRSLQVEEVPRLISVEGEKILGKVRSDDFLILLDSRGKVFTSEEFSNQLLTYQIRSLGKVIFVIGGHEGVSQAVRTRANELIALSRMTFNHEMARVVLLEQIYRAFTIIHHFPYHR
jgi:23S rRNA (pseudouridine1915-N3)-methyltransferase